MQVLPNLRTQQLDEETKSSFDVSLCLEPPSLQAELNRFKEIQKHPQLLLQTLFQMENQKPRQVEDLRLPIKKNEHEAIEIVANKNHNESNSLVCYICGNLLRRSSMYAHLKGHNGCTYACTIDQCSSVYKSKQSLTKHQLVHHLKRTTNSGKNERRISSADQVENGKKSHICVREVFSIKICDFGAYKNTHWWKTGKMSPLLQNISTEMRFKKSLKDLSPRCHILY
ncbi:uncharacterized protein LOC119085028 isoform X2 [Bradysia coprophila]|uniref:uncharacterized protein LOC119085028 isoform X2 n=1 Tax=Bradysia coprophila TaxID=38358 RepID=UPI00187D7EA5|nr:uncharacterized protein LOC119085028 isoform X2 [Bradysia coprophila]